MIEQNLILENENLVLRPLLKDDFESLITLTKDGNMWYFFTHDLSNSEEFEKWVQPAFDGQRVQFVVWDKRLDTAVGSTGFGNYSERDRRIEIGWTWLGTQHHGSGVNQIMKKLMLKYCFEILFMQRVEFKTDVLNIPARKALLKLGAIEEGVLRSHTLLTNGRRRDTIFYSVLPEDWERIKGGSVM